MRPLLVAVPDTGALPSSLQNFSRGTSDTEPNCACAATALASPTAKNIVRKRTAFRAPKKATAEAKRNASNANSSGNDGGGRFAPGLEYEILKADAVVLLGLAHALSYGIFIKTVFPAGLDGYRTPAPSRQASQNNPVVSNNITSAVSDSSSRNASSLCISAIADSSPACSVASTPAPAPALAQGRGRLFGRWGTSTVHHLVLVRVHLEIQTRQRQHARPRAGRPRTQGKGALRRDSVREIVVAGAPRFFVVQRVGSRTPSLCFMCVPFRVSFSFAGRACLPAYFVPGTRRPIRYVVCPMHVGVAEILIPIAAPRRVLRAAAHVLGLADLVSSPICPVTIFVWDRIFGYGVVFQRYLHPTCSLLSLPTLSSCSHLSLNKFSAAKGMGSVTSPVLIGSLPNLCSFGILLVQVCVLHIPPKDSRLVKCLVYSMLFAITFDTCLNVTDVQFWYAASDTFGSLLLQASTNASTRLVAKDIVQVILETNIFSATVALVALILFISCPVCAWFQPLNHRKWLTLVLTGRLASAQRCS
ncbi:hypothetical protein K438DRAFT_2031297 [Mycena galopus ATCC 62051]|nr:hypothetical protein K438DRAFT_2031297 [Mycena galopus ATCC 62051]